MVKKLIATHVGILGVDTLLGREVKEIVEGRGSAGKLHAYSVEGDARAEKAKKQEKAEESEGEAVTLEPLTAKSIQNTSAVLLTGSLAAANQAYDLAKAAGGSPVVIDCLGQLESRSEARIVAPLLNESGIEGNWLLVLAHPAASALALMVTRLARYRKLRTVVANIFEPASERGKPGVSELHQQTTALLTFKPLDKAIFDTQVSFNMLPRIGEDAPIQLLSTETRINRHLATLLRREEGSAAIPAPSIRVMQAPVFHGYSISAWVEFEADVHPQEIEEALASAQIEIRRYDEEPPDNVGAAGQSGLIAGDIRMDRNNPRAAWIWVVMDNLRIMADSAADIVRNLQPRVPVIVPPGKRKS